MSDELDRYKQLLSDWKVSDRPPKRNEPRAAEGSPVEEGRLRSERSAGRAKLARPTVEETREERFPKGTILSLDDEELVIYRRPVAGKEDFDMVYSLLADGSVKIEGVNLKQHDIVELGLLTAGDLKQLQNEMKWGRNLIAPNCYSLEDGERIPGPAASGEAPVEEKLTRPGSNDRAGTAAAEAEPKENHVDPVGTREAAKPVDTPPPPKKKTVRRGVMLKINFGDRFWDAVYWGKDKKGTVVAHRTHGRWTLMHLDLNRFKETMDTSGKPDPKLIKEIMDDLRRKKKS